MRILVLFIFLYSLAIEARLRPTQVLLEESTQLNNFFYGGYDGVGGGDLVDIRKLTAWFYNDKPIKTCFHVTQSFGLNEIELKQLISMASQEWSDFFLKKKINTHYKQPISTNIELSPKCMGGEDLVFYFGTGPIFQNLSDMRARQLLVRPLAYVNKTHMTQDMLWSKGYIRFVEPYLYLNHRGRLYPDWSKKEDTYNMILHELGHVFGFLHVSDSVMDSKIAQILFARNKPELFKAQMAPLFPSTEGESYSVNSNSHPFWQKTNKIQIYQNPTKVIIDKNEVEVLYELSDKEYPLLANIHQQEAFSFQKTRLVFFKYKERTFTLEKKTKELEIREKGRLLFKARRIKN